MPAIQAMTATMCSAFSQRYIESIQLRVRASSQLPAANAREHALDMRNWRFRQNAMAKVEYERAATEFFHDVVNLAVERCTACKQGDGVAVALQRHSRLQHIPRNGSLEGSVNSKRAHPGHFHVRQGHCSGPTRETYDFRPWYMTAHTFHNLLRGSDAPAVKLIRPQHSGPGIENLNNLRTGPELTHKIVN